MCYLMSGILYDLCVCFNIVIPTSIFISLTFFTTCIYVIVAVDDMKPIGSSLPPDNIYFAQVVYEDQSRCPHLVWLVKFMVTKHLNALLQVNRCRVS